MTSITVTFNRFTPYSCVFLLLTLSREHLLLTLMPAGMIIIMIIMLIHCVKSVQTQSFFWSVFPVFSPNAGKYGPEKTSYLDNFHAVIAMMIELASKNNANVFDE